MTDLHLKSLNSLTAEKIVELKAFLRDGSLPTIDGQSVATRRTMISRFKKSATGLKVEGDSLFLVVDEPPPWSLAKDGSILYTVVLPFDMKIVDDENEAKRIIVRYYSDRKTNGYRSADSFYKKLSQEFIGIGRNLVRDVLKSIETKQTQLPAQQRIVKPIISEKPMTQWELDLIDMSSYSHFNNNTTFCLTVIDTHSKFAWVRPLKNKTSALVASELQMIIQQEGAPQIISSDNGTEFKNEHFDVLMSRFQIEQRFSLPYKPTSQGQVERFNGTLKRSIYAHMAENETKNYVDVLQFLVFSYNSHTHNTTRFTPFQSHRGRDSKISMMLAGLITEKLVKKGDQMIANSMKSNNPGVDKQLVIGDKVRVMSMSLKSVRKLSHIQRNSRTITNWSIKLYTVVDVGVEAVEEKYKIDIDGKEENRWYQRVELMKVDADELVDKRGINDEEKEDLNFGLKFDREQHLRSLALSRSERKEADKGMDEIDKDAVAEEKRRGKRIRKIVDRGAFIDYSDDEM